jgi:hypothetical protein
MSSLLHVFIYFYIYSIMLCWWFLFRNDCWFNVYINYTIINYEFKSRLTIEENCTKNIVCCF